MSRSCIHSVVSPIPQCKNGRLLRQVQQAQQRRGTKHLRHNQNVPRDPQKHAALMAAQKECVNLPWTVQGYGSVHPASLASAWLSTSAAMTTHDEEQVVLRTQSLTTHQLWRVPVNLAPVHAQRQEVADHAGVGRPDQAEAPEAQLK